MDIRHKRTAFLLGILLTGCISILTACTWQEEPVKTAMADSIMIKESESANQKIVDRITDMQVAVESVKEPIKVKGIYVTGPVAGIDKMDELIALVDETELNAMVIDIKNDMGVITYKMQSETVLEIESGMAYVQDMEGLIQKLKEKDIYLIARIVAFKDPYLAEKKPELSLKTQNGEIFRDRNGEAWVNPYNHEVWDYLMEIGIEAAEIGFDEIQFDYIRFTTDNSAGEIDYGRDAETKTKEQVIADFTQFAHETLHPLGVAVSADVFGTIIDNETDAEIVGQDYRVMAENLDYVCPMVYPSHYANGAYGIAVPDKAPYDTVYHAMMASQRKLTGVQAGVRVWIQDFTAVWLNDYISYGPEEVRAQIQAAYDAGYEEWILWNARTNYTEGALIPNWTEPREEAEAPVDETERLEATE
ncbi:MAG: putative glycoside hydrolase [Lachnospiraceae bacterium]|nr:putative glycoside hydrolase [Lachnospiraceae bacterium]